MRWFIIFVGSILVAIGLGVGALDVFGAVPSSTPRQSVISALSATAKQPSEHVAMTTTVNSTASGAETISLVGDQINSTGLPNGNFTVTSPGTNLQDRVTNGAIYINFGKALKLPKGATWMGINTKSLSKSVVLKDVTGLFSGSNGDPSEVLSMFGAAKNSAVNNLGAKDIGGVPTTHYAMKIDFQKLVDRPGATYEQLLQSLQHYVTGSKILVSVFVDGQGLVRQISYGVTEQASLNGAATEFAITVKLDFSDFGESVHPIVPPKATVYELPPAKVQKFFSALTGS